MTFGISVGVGLLVVHSSLPDITCARVKSEMDVELDDVLFHLRLTRKYSSKVRCQGVVTQNAFLKPGQYQDGAIRESEADRSPPRLVRALLVPTGVRLNQVAEPEHGIPGADRRAGDHLHFVERIVVGQKAIDGLHGAGLERAFCAAAGENDPDLAGLLEKIGLAAAGRVIRVQGRMLNRLQPVSHQRPIDENCEIVGNEEGAEVRRNDRESLKQINQASRHQICPREMLEPGFPGGLALGLVEQ